MNATNALKTARSAVSLPVKQGPYSWSVIHPWRDIDGPSAETTATSYPAAMVARQQCVASLALHLLDAPDEYINHALYGVHDAASVRAVVTVYLAGK